MLPSSLKKPKASHKIIPVRAHTYPQPDGEHSEKAYFPHPKQRTAKWFVNGSKIKTSSASMKRTSLACYLLKFCMILSQVCLLNISASKDLIKCWGWNWSLCWCVCFDRRMQGCLGTYCIEWVLASAISDRHPSWNSTAGKMLFLIQCLFDFSQRHKTTNPVFI
jgi:hypothetical protein